MLYDKKTKALFHQGNEKVWDILTQDQCEKLSRFFRVHLVWLAEYSGHPKELNEHFFMHFGEKEPKTVFSKIYSFSLRELYLMIEIFSRILLKKYRLSLDKFLDYLQDINNLFMIEKIPLQLIYVQETSDLFMEKVIDDIHSEKAKEILTKFSKYKKIHEDFKQAIVFYSSGNNKDAIEKCCVAIEDYLCVIQKKDSCHNIESYYKDVAKKLKIPIDINERFKSMISFIHNYRSKPLHGSKKKYDPENPHLIAQVIIGFTMVILHYLYIIFER